jgi:hypothetical protein
LYKAILADRIKQLINVTKELLLKAQGLQSSHDRYLPASLKESSFYKNSEIALLARFLHTTFYYDALLNLNTILNRIQKKQDKKEQSIFELIEYETDQGRKNKLSTKATELIIKLEAKNLHKWRNKLVGHKDIGVAGDTEIMYLNFIKEEYLDYTISLINDLDSFMIQYYDVAANNTFAEMYSKSFEKMSELFEKELRKTSKNLTYKKNNRARE